MTHAASIKAIAEAVGAAAQGPILGLDLLEGARAARTDPVAAEAAVLAAVAASPNDLDVRTGAYKFYLYNHRWADAAPQAGACLRIAAHALGLPVDWRLVQRADAAFDTLDKGPRVYLQALIALGYVQARLGRLDDARRLITKAADLDRADRFGASRLLAVLARGGIEDDPYADA
jgi:hypothetical protein